MWTSSNHALVVSLLVLSVVVGLRADETWPDVIESLLEREAAWPDWREHMPYAAGPPPEDAPREILVAWWAEHGGRDLEPSDPVRQRLLEAVEEHPHDLLSLLDVLPKTPTAYAIVHRVYREHPGWNPYWREDVSYWLEEAKDKSHDELVAEALATDPTLGYVGGDAALELLRRDRLRGRSVLQQLTSHDEEDVQTFALCALYRDSLEHGERTIESERHNLQKIVLDSTRSSSSRDDALEALMESEWSGRDEWFLGLFNLEITRSGDGELLAAGLAPHRERLLPRVLKLVSSGNGTERMRAAACLLRLEESGAEVLLPLLPLLSSPFGLDEDAIELLGRLGKVKVPESVPTLIALVRRVEDWRTLATVIAALRAQGDPRAAPALRRLLAELTAPGQHNVVFRALQEYGGFETDEKAEALEAFAQQSSTEEGRRAWKDADHRAYREPYGPAIDPTVSLGAYLRESGQIDDELSRRLFRRADELDETAPQIARALRKLLIASPEAAVPLDTIEQILARPPDAETLDKAIENREAISKHGGDALRRVIDAGGYPAGVASLLLGDSDLQATILDGKDRPAQLALLACARLARTRLPLGPVGRLLAEDGPLLSRAAEAYLIANDHPAARELVRAHHPGEFLILGGWNVYDMTAFGTEGLRDWRSRIIKLIQGDDAPDQIVALFSRQYWRRFEQRIILVRGEHAELLHRLDDFRYRRRKLRDEEWHDFRRFIEQTDFFDLPPLTLDVTDGTHYDAFRVTPKGGRLVFMNNPGTGESAASAYDLFVRRFERLTVSEEPARYDVFDTLPGARIVVPDAHALAVWGRESDVLVLRRDGDDKIWHTLEGEQLGAPAQKLPDWARTLWVERSPECYPGNDTPSIWQARWREGFVVSSERNEKGSWSRQALKWFSEKEGVRRLFEGEYARPVVSPDGNWLLAELSGAGGWMTPDTIVRIDLRRSQVIPVDLEAAQPLQPVAWIDARGSALIRRGGGWEADPADAEFYLCDPTNGVTKRVEGDFRPWFHLTNRPFQPTGREHEVWAALPEENKTSVGRYRTDTFSFTPVKTYEPLEFDSSAMWVDERNHVVLVASGDVLRLPF